MSRVLITGSAAGLGREAARLLVGAGHEVVLHARDEGRTRAALAAVPGAAAALPGDLASIAQTTELAHRANESGPFDAVIHNAAIGYREPRRIETEDGLAHVFQVNVLAPYLLTALVRRPDRLIFLSSGLHRAGYPDLYDLQWEQRRWNGYQAYADAKLFDAVLAAAVARRWPDVLSNSVDPGWVKTKMGGPTAPGEIGPAAETQAWLAVSDDSLAFRSGDHFHHRQLWHSRAAVSDHVVQDGLFEACHGLTGHALVTNSPRELLIKGGYVVV
ncbi:MAG: short-chain dehydrogenase/reductase [Actinomycetia bacterium]|jgi:NAD(P)-dependent dehydrogenase (short-subunit alcohol dehydrogenase family)|nr:short-chain dehydrogenase/reductase [Actinomycetes bacterium]